MAVADEGLLLLHKLSSHHRLYSPSSLLEHSQGIRVEDEAW